MNDGQQNLFGENGLERWWEEHWQGMPEFVMGNTEPIQKITVSFDSAEDVKRFGELIGQRLTPRTDSIWFPIQTDYVAPRYFSYVDSEYESEIPNLHNLERSVG
jgi:hypothetical protein